MCLAQGPQRSDAGKVQTRGPSVSSMDTSKQVLWLTEMLHKGGLHCLLRWKQSSGADIYQSSKILTCDPALK